MLKRLSRIATLATAAVLASGCGTFANTVWLTDEEGGKRVYGGVRAELSLMKEADGPADACRMAFDVPLTVIGDTITLPFTLSYSLWFRSPPTVKRDN